MTKKIGHLFEKVYDEENLKAAIKNSQRGNKAKKSWQIRDFNRMYEADQEGTIREMKRMIMELDFPKHHSRIIKRKTDSGKVRQLDDEDYHPWKWLGHAIMQVMQQVVNRSLIMDTCCCIPKRGNIHCVRRMKMYLRRYPEYTWFAKGDCRKYYQLISPEYMDRVLHHKFKDERFIKLFQICCMDYWCGEEIEKEGENERAKKERCANWRVSKWTDRQPEPGRSRPHHDGALPHKDGTQLRRRGVPVPDEGRSAVRSQPLRPAPGGKGNDLEGR